MRHYSLHKFLALLLVAIGSVTVAIAQNVAKIGTTEYATLQEAIDAVPKGSGGYIEVIADATFNELTIRDKTINLDLLKHTIKGNYIDVINEGAKLYIKDTSPDKALSVDKDNDYAVSYTNVGTIELMNGFISAYYGANITVWSGKIESKNKVALYAMGDDTGQKDVKSSVTILGGYIKAKSYCASPQGRGASVTIEGNAVLESLDNAVVAGNGTNTTAKKLGDTSITIAGKCWLIGRTQTAGYAACGIYHPQQGTLTIKYSGGIPNIVAVNGAGIVMRGGTLDYRAGNIIATGDASFVGKVGDSPVEVGTSGIVYDRDCGYYDVANAKITIPSSGEKKVVGAKAAIQVINDSNNNIDDVFDIRGGQFSSDVSALLDENSVDEEKNGVYVVTTYYAQIGETKYATLQEAADAATAGQTVKVLNDVDMTTGSNLIVKAGKDIVLDMNGHSIKGANADYKNILVWGKLTLKDSKENSTSKIYAETPYQYGVYDKPLVYVGGTGEFVMESGHIYSVIPEKTADNGQFGIGAYDNSKVTINGGTIESGWYAIAGNGSGVQTTTITINGGTLVSTSDYAIYHPQFGTLTINDGTVVYGAAGVIAMKRGNLVVNGGTMTSKGIGDTGNWGDGTGNLGKAALNFCAPYGDVAATIKGGTITAEGDAVLIDAKPTEGITVTLAISGGTYSSDVSQYCVEGFTATPNADGTYGISEVGDGMIFVYDKTSEKIAANGSVTIDLDKINKVSLTKEVAGVTTTLTKNFENTGWNAFFAPFGFTLTQEMLNDFDFATLYAITLKNGSGSQLLSYVEANDGDKIKAYFPCLIKAKIKGVQSLNVGSVSYKPITEMKPVTTSSTIELFTFYPVMENTYFAAKNGYYLNPEKNSFVYNENAEAYIPPFKYYMTIQNKDDNSYILPTAGKASVVEFRVIGADEVTGITDVEGAAALEAGKVYNLQGVVVGDSVENLPKGIYIRNGRKVVVK